MLDHVPGRADKPSGPSRSSRGGEEAATRDWKTPTALTSRTGTYSERSKISKACQECRKRKIRCDGTNPCLPCQQRHTTCQFRQITRRRKKVNEPRPESKAATPSSGVSGTKSPEEQSATEVAEETPRKDLHNSVSAVQRNLPSRGTVQIYFGPTSDFSLTQNIYQQLFTKSVNLEEGEGAREKTTEFLDALPVRHIFFGSVAHQQPRRGEARSNTIGTGPVLIQFELASSLLDRYLSTYYNVTPFLPKSVYRKHLQHLCGATTPEEWNSNYNSVVLLAIAISSQSSRDWQWGEFLFQKVTQETQGNGTLECIQLDILMISLPFSTCCRRYALLC